MRDVMQDPGDQPASDDQHQRNEQRDLDDGHEQHAGNPEAKVGDKRTMCRRGAAAALLQARQRGKQHQSEHHRQVFNNQPADGDAAALRLHQTALLHGAKQHDGTRNRQRQPEHQTGADGPAHRHRHAKPQQCRDRDLHDGPGHGDRLHRKQILQGEMQADPEHQQYDTELCQFVGERLIGDEAGREGPRGNAGEKIADQRLNAEALGNRAEYKG
jgi:hypothetical protein